MLDTLFQLIRSVFTKIGLLFIPSQSESICTTTTPEPFTCTNLVDMCPDIPTYLKDFGEAGFQYLFDGKLDAFSLMETTYGECTGSLDGQPIVHCYPGNELQTPAWFEPEACGRALVVLGSCATLFGAWEIYKFCKSFRHKPSSHSPSIKKKRK